MIDESGNVSHESGINGALGWAEVIETQVHAQTLS